jgi:biopolymer transport protein ExbD/biopolymer transport protein TolR
VCAITRDGNTFLGTTKTAPEDMIQKVKDLIATRLDKTVFIKADSRAKYEKVVEVIENLRAAGVDQLGLLTEQATEKKPGATSVSTGGQ